MTNRGYREGVFWNNSIVPDNLRIIQIGRAVK